MKIRMITVLLLFFTFNLAFSQEEYKSNSNLESVFITEVYGSSIDKNSQLYKNLQVLLRERIIFIQQQEKQFEKYQKLADIPLFNKYNSSLVRDVVFDKNTFNVLKYNLTFYSNFPKIYRIDSNWLIKVEPQNKNN